MSPDGWICSAACLYITTSLPEEKVGCDLGSGDNLWLPVHAPSQVCGWFGFFRGGGIVFKFSSSFFLVWCQCRAKLMAYGCQRSLIMKAPYFWWSQSTFLSSHTKMWNVCVVWPEPTWRWQYEGDWHILLCSAGMMTNMYTPAMATDCTVHEKIWILKTVSTKQRKQTP